MGCVIAYFENLRRCCTAYNVKCACLSDQNKDRLLTYLNRTMKVSHFWKAK